MSLETSLKHLLRDVPNFPKPGIIFKDITPLLAEPKIRGEVVKMICQHFGGQQIEAVAAVEARGFIFGALIAHELGVPFIPIRKAGKLPSQKIKEEYLLEYGKATIEMHSDAIPQGCRVLIHDDLLATGGTASAVGNMIERLGGIIAGYSFIINLAFLPGDIILKNRFKVNPHYLVSFD